jgi:hypothetical protein
VPEASPEIVVLVPVPMVVVPPGMGHVHVPVGEGLQVSRCLSVLHRKADDNMTVSAAGVTGCRFVTALTEAGGTSI